MGGYYAKYEKSKTFIIGMIFGILISLSLPSFAASVVKQIEAYYNDIKIVVDGNLITPKDANGNIVEPFIYNGTTYLPVRAIANALGQSVSWDGKTSTVYIGKNEKIDQPSIWLKDMNTFAGSEFKKKPGAPGAPERISDNTGKQYDNFLYDQFEGDVTYLLNQQYKKFTGRFILREEYKNSGFEFRFKVYTDDNLIYTSPIVKTAEFPVDFDIDVSGAIKMRIVVEARFASSEGDWKVTRSENTSNYVAFVNAGLWK